MKPLPRLFVPFLLLNGVAVVAAPVARWDFGEEDTSRAVVVGTVQRDAPGPRPPQFPDFDSYNTALRLDGTGGHLALTDPGAGSVLDFSNGDAITLEAWVQVDGFKANDQLYVVGKGRTGAPGFAADNQNWALRVRAVSGQFGVNFLSLHREARLRLRRRLRRRKSRTRIGIVGRRNPVSRPTRVGTTSR